MNYLEDTKKLPYSEKALGFSFSKPSAYTPFLPDHACLIGCGETIYFCCIDGYQETVFAVRNEPGFGPCVCPLAYDFHDFLRLSAAFGSSLAAANAGFRILCGKNVLRVMPDDLQRSSMCMLVDSLSLNPIPRPMEYLKTIVQVIDCSYIRL